MQNNADEFNIPMNAHELIHDTLAIFLGPAWKLYNFQPVSWNNDQEKISFWLH